MDEKKQLQKSKPRSLKLERLAMRLDSLLEYCENDIPIIMNAGTIQSAWSPQDMEEVLRALNFYVSHWKDKD